MTTSLILSIDRTSLSLSALSLSAAPNATSLGVATYREPGRLARITYAPDSPFVNGSQALSANWQQTFHSFSVLPQVATEALADAALDELQAAIEQFAFTLTVTKNGGTPRAWACDRGSMEPAGDRTRIDLQRAVPVWNVTIPCYPIPS